MRCGKAPVNTKLELMGCKDFENLKPTIYDNVVLSAQKEYLAFLTLSGANGKKFGGLKDQLENQSLFGHDNYPKDHKYKSLVAMIERFNRKIQKAWLSFKLVRQQNNLIRQTTTRITRAVLANPSRILQAK